MKTFELLQEARNLIDKPEKWCRGGYAKNRAGRNVPVDYQEACQFCALGAVKRAAANYVASSYEADSYLNDVCFDKHGSSVITFNDNEKATHADILALYDAAIEQAFNDESLDLFDGKRAA